MTTIYHNPRCSTSRATLQLLQDRGIAPQIIEYLETPPNHAELAALIKDAGLTVRQAMRQKEALYKELGLDDPAMTDDQLIDAVVRNPVLLERPFVVTEKGVRLCRPITEVEAIL